MKFQKTNKKYIDSDDDEIAIINEMDTQLNEIDHMPKAIYRLYDSIVLSYMRHSRISNEQYNKLIEIYEKYCEHDEVTELEE